MACYEFFVLCTPAVLDFSCALGDPALICSHCAEHIALEHKSSKRVYRWGAQYSGS